MAPLLKHWFVVVLLAGQAPVAAPTIHPIAVPPELAAVTSNPELSGIVWSKKRNRYLLVTDDSGSREDDTAHRPLLLAMTDKGVLDPKPVVIRGVDRLNDPESICAGPDGTYFLVTSHSPNRSNKTSHSRRQLLQLRDNGDALDVVGQLDLTAIKGSRSLLSLLGLPQDGRLDIEAVAFHDAALFIGFKSPLTDAGNAVVARLASPLFRPCAGEKSNQRTSPGLRHRHCAWRQGNRRCVRASPTCSSCPTARWCCPPTHPKGARRTTVEHSGICRLRPTRARRSCFDASRSSSPKG